MNFDAYVGIPFLDKGRGYDGADCWGLVWLFYRDALGIELPCGTERYATAADRAEAARVIDGGLPDWLPVEGRPGDVALLQRGEAPCHVGLLTATGWLLHLREGHDSVQQPIERLQRMGYGLVGFYRYRHL